MVLLNKKEFFTWSSEKQKLNSKIYYDIKNLYIM